LSCLGAGRAGSVFVSMDNMKGTISMVKRRRLALCVVLSIGFGLCMLAVPGRGAQDEPNPIVAQVKAKVKNPKKPFTMLVRLELKEGANEQFEAAFAPAIKATRAEKGCITYDLSQDLDHSGSYVLYERWKSLADLQAHLNAEHIKSLLPKVHELSVKPPELQVLAPAAE
jgi:quinol monooxygenase YgiN